MPTDNIMNARIARLYLSPLPEECKNQIMRNSQPAFGLLLLGLPARVIRCVLDASEPCVLQGTPHWRDVADLQAHRGTKKREDFRYIWKNRTLAAIEASKALREKRSKFTASQTRKFVPLPGSTKGKQNTKICGPRRSKQKKPSLLSQEVRVEDLQGVSKEDFGTMEDFFNEFCNNGDEDASMVDFDDDTYINWSVDQEGESDVEATGSSETEPDDYEIEMAKAEEEQRLNERSEEQIEPAPETTDLEIPGFVAINTEVKQRKRERESECSPLPGQDDHNDKRIKLEIDTDSSPSPTRTQRKKTKYQPGQIQAHELFCRSSSLAAIFEAAIAVGAQRASQEDSSDAPPLDALDLELLGEEPNGSQQTSSSLCEDSKMFICETMFPVVSQDDLRVANAGGNLLGIHLGNSEVSELGSADREALGKALGNSAELQPQRDADEEQSGFTAIPRTATRSGRSTRHRELHKKYGYSIKRDEKPTKPSRDFQSFFATRRLRQDILRKDAGSCSAADKAFVMSGKLIEEPGPKFGAEFVAKCLLDGKNSPLRKIVKDSQMSSRRRQKRASQKVVKGLSQKDKRKMALLETLGLGVNKPRVEKCVPRAQEKKPKPETPPLDPSLEIKGVFTVGSLRSEVEEELALWEEEEEEEL